MCSQLGRQKIELKVDAVVPLAAIVAKAMQLATDTDLGIAGVVAVYIAKRGLDVYCEGYGVQGDQADAEQTSGG